MTKQRQSLKTPRSIAYIRQNGKCFYCKQSMWVTDPEHFAKQHRLKLQQAKLLQCTGEHLTAHSNNGSSATANIAAACWFCNSHRHRTKKPLSPNTFGKRVRQRLSQNKWHGIRIEKLEGDSC